MTIIQEIHKWSQNLPAWQQDAVRRLFFYWRLSSGDLDDLLAMAKSASDMEDSGNRISLELGDADLAVQPGAERLVQFSVIKNVVDVSALTKAQSLITGSINLTLISGNKGSAEAGYPKISEDYCVPS